MVTALIVGAGAVGQVYGHYLQRGGASVSYFVKEQYKEECEKGFTLYRSRRSGLGHSEYFKADAIYTEFSELKDCEFDQVWLTVPSTALRGDCLPKLKAVIGDATVVMLQPDLDDRDFVMSVFPPEQVVCGIVNFISYQTPLPDLPDHHPDADKHGVAYMLMPMMTAEFSGSPERVPDVAEAMASGRFNVKVEKDATRAYADRSAWMIPLVASLELENWSFKRLQLSSTSLDLAVDAAKEALHIVAAKFGKRQNWTERLFSLFWVKMALPLIRFLSPMDAESFVKFHFMKTAPQTRLMLRTFIDEGHKLGQPTAHLESLLDKLPEEPVIKKAA